MLDSWTITDEGPQDTTGRAYMRTSWADEMLETSRELAIEALQKMA